MMVVTVARAVGCVVAVAVDGATSLGCHAHRASSCLEPGRCEWSWDNATTIAVEKIGVLPGSVD